MIEISKLTDADKGREVRYTAQGLMEYGRITSWNEKFVFVRYHMKVTLKGTQIPRYGDTSEATDPVDLAFTF